MANAEHLEILKSGVENWNKWLNQNLLFHDTIHEGLKGNPYFADLSEVNLSGADLVGIDLTGINLSGADLSEANLTGANLNGFLPRINLSSKLTTDNLLIYMSRANRFRVNLSGANLSNARIYLAALYNANMSGANVSGAKIFGTNLSNANLSNANLSGSKLDRVNLTNANLSGADITGAHLHRVDLTEAYLSESNFTGAAFSKTVFGFTDLNACLGLDTVLVGGDCIIDFHTLRASKNIPKSFLLKIGLPELYVDYLPDFYSDALSLFPAFLSHSKENREFAYKLYEALIAKGVNVFFDEKQLKPGDSLVKTITKGINHYDKTILICSKESLASTWVDYELELVLKKELDLIEQQGTDDVGLLIPITIDDHIYSWKGPKEWDIKTRFIGDFREWQDSAKFERALNELIQALNVKRLDIKPPTHF